MVIPKCESPNRTLSTFNWLPDCFKDHGAKLVDVPDEYLADTLVIAKKIAKAIGAEDYNILQVLFLDRVLIWFLTSVSLQNNGRAAHQVGGTI